jgi:hypothetical protein
MVKHVEAALHLVNDVCCSIIFSLRPLGHLCKKIILYLNNHTLHLFYHDKLSYVQCDFLGTRMEGSVQFLWTEV